MNTLAIESIMNGYLPTASTFIGCFPSDRIPTKIPSSCSFIVNCDKSYMPGSHWFAVHISRTNIYIFDSFGTLPRTARNWLNRRRRQGFPEKRVCYNAVAHQSPNEVTCGGYAIYVLCQLALGRRFSSIVAEFCRTQFDDAFIRRYLTEVHQYEMPLSL